MQNKLLSILILSVFFGCSSDKNTELQHAVNIFDNKNTLPLIRQSKLQDTKLDNVDFIVWFEMIEHIDKTK